MASVQCHRCQGWIPEVSNGDKAPVDEQGRVVCLVCIEDLKIEAAQKAQAAEATENPGRGFGFN